MWRIALHRRFGRMVHPDLLASKGSPQLPETLLSPLFLDSNPKNFLLSSPEPLLTLLSLNRNSPGSPAGAPQMCFMPILEDNGRDYEERHTKEWPDCSWKCNALNQTEMEEGLMIQSLWHLSQHVSLANRAGRLQQRVLAVLGDHASRHYSQQLDSLKKKKRLETCCAPNYSMTSDPFFDNFNAADVDQGVRRNLQFTQPNKQPLKSRDLEKLSLSGHAVLQGLLESLDSDATASSSDEEWDHEGTKSVKSHCAVCESRWLKDRAELCSRWTWMQMRLSELDSQIQQIGKLQQQILYNKGRVVLAETQPLTDRQIQHTLWTETMDLSFTAGNMRDMQSDLELEPSSPTRLLRNIERQSAQLNQIVTSLMPSFYGSPSSSPLSKGRCNHWTGQQKTTYGSSLQCLPKAKKRKRTCHRRQYIPQMDVTFMSARTRPLLNYHKPRLFIMDTLAHREQVLKCSSSVFPKCAPCDSASADPACPCIKKRTDSKVHPILSMSSETPPSFHLQNALFEESVLQRSLHLKSELFNPHHCLRSKGRVSRSLFHYSHQPKNRGHLKRRRRESTPIRWTGTRDYRSQAYRESKRRKFYSERPMDMQTSPESDLVSQSDDSHVEEPLDVNVSYFTPLQQRSSQFSVRRRNWESIENIVIPMSLLASMKVEKLQYKNILTPSWRKLNISPLLQREDDEQEKELSEAIEDSDFFKRHQVYEHREKLYWSCWDQDSQGIRPSRRSRCSLSLKGHPAHCHPPAHSPVPSIFSPPEDLEDDRELLPPWKRRMFPLADEDEETLRFDEENSF